MVWYIIKRLEWSNQKNIHRCKLTRLGEVVPQGVVGCHISRNEVLKRGWKGYQDQYCRLRWLRIELVLIWKYIQIFTSCKNIVISCQLNLKGRLLLLGSKLGHKNLGYLWFYRWSHDAKAWNSSWSFLRLILDWHWKISSKNRYCRT